MHSTSSIIALALLASAFCFLPAAEAGAEKADSTSSVCGATPRESIALAEKALADKRPESQTRALSCLLTAMKVFEAERLDAVRGKDHSRMLRVPRNP